MVLRIIGITYILFCSALTHAQSPKQQAAEAYRLYADSALESSAKLYEESLSQEPNSEYLFNLGNSYQKLGELDKARKAYQGVLNSSSSSEELRSKASYNLGNLEYNENDYGKAIEHYKQTLIDNPEDVQASENLQIALAQMQMQQQEQQQQQQNQEQQQDQQESEEGNEQPQQPEEGEEDNTNQSEQGEQEQNESGEEEVKPDQPSQSTKISKDQAEDFFKRLDEAESQTKSRLNDNTLKEKNKANNKKITKDW